MQVENLSFKDACKALGAWQEPDGKRATLVRRVVGRDLALTFDVAGTAYTVKLQDDTNDLWKRLTPYSWTLRRIFADARDRLHELHRGDQETFEGETENCWSLLATSWELMQLEVANG
jgi:hypothetical protein